MRGSCKIAQLCVAAALIGACTASKDSDGGGASSGTGSNAAPTGMMMTGSGGAAGAMNPSSITGNPSATQTGSGGMPAAGMMGHGSGGSSAGNGKAGDGAGGDDGSGGMPAPTSDGGSADSGGGGTTEPMHDIAFLLGFSECAAFVRAFKRWSGKAPLEYRKALV